MWRKDGDRFSFMKMQLGVQFVLAAGSAPFLNGKILLYNIKAEKPSE